MNHKLLAQLLVCCGFLGTCYFTACSSSETPKPRGYFRIDLPVHAYRDFDTAYPYRFVYPDYARIVPKSDSNAEPYWINVEFPRFKGTIHLSYKKPGKDLNLFTEESRALVMKHIPKASGIREVLINRPEEKVFGRMFFISGNEAASPIQFYLTDSARNFVRGALYFWVSPNNDSLKPVIDFLEEDIVKMLDSFRWVAAKTE